MNYQTKVIMLSLVFGVGFYWLAATAGSHAGSELRNSLEVYSAAVNDSGYNSHKQLHIEQEHKDIQIKDTYVKWSK